MWIHEMLLNIAGIHLVLVVVPTGLVSAMGEASIGWCSLLHA